MVHAFEKTGYVKFGFVGEKKVRLGDICEVVSGSTPKTFVEGYWDGELDWITPAELSNDSYIINESVRKITLLGVKKTGLKSFPINTVILSSRAPIGKVALAGKEMYCNQGFKNFICSDVIVPKYLYWFFKGKSDYLNSLGRGATFKEISKEIVENIEIKLPSTKKQEDIVKKFEVIRGIMQFRKLQLEQLDTLIKARFVELFGDVIANSKNLPTMPLGKVCYLKAGTTTSADEIFDYSTETPIPCYGGNGIRGYVKKATQNGEYPIIGRQGALCGNVQFATGEFHATEHAVIVKSLHEDNIVWLRYVLKYLDLYRYHTGAAQPGLSVKVLNTIDIPIAEKELQNQFAAFVEQTDKLKVEVQKSLAEMQID